MTTPPYSSAESPAASLDDTAEDARAEGDAPCAGPADPLQTAHLLSVSVREEYDLVSVRGRARRLTDLLGFNSAARTRLTTALSEVSRVLLRGVGGCDLRMALRRRGQPALLVFLEGCEPDNSIARAADDGAADPAARGTAPDEATLRDALRNPQRLVDEFDVGAESQGRPCVELAMLLPGRAPSPRRLAKLIRELADGPGGDPFADILQQNRELVTAQTRLGELNRRLQETQEAKDRFIALLGHELRNQVNGLRNSLEAFERSRDEAVRERMRKLNWAQVRHLTQLADDLMDSARVVRGDLRVNPEVMELSRYLAFCADTWRDTVEDADMAWRYEPPEGDVWVMADPSRLSQIIANLVSNARKFTDPGGAITLGAESIGDQVWIEVRDTGCGIEPEHLHDVLEPFRQTDSAQRRMTGGLGLGLAIVRGLVEAQGGAMTIDSDPSKRPGTVVRFSLPRTEAPNDGILPTVGIDLRLLETRQAVEPVPRRTTRIFLVDDHETSAESLATLLDLEGFDVTVARSGRQALDEIDASYDFVLCDLGLPEIDGFAVAETLRERFAATCPTLVAMSGFTDASIRERIEAAGFVEFFAKPVDTDALRRFLESAG